MEYYARIEKGIVVEVLEIDETIISFNKLFSEEFQNSCIKCNKDIKVGFLYRDNTFIGIPLTEEDIAYRNFLDLGLDTYKAYLSSIITKLRDEQILKGMPYKNNDLIQLDSISLQNANGFLASLAIGLPILPIKWRTKANIILSFTTLDSFKSFSIDLLSYIQTIFHYSWLAKDSIINLDSFDLIWDTFKTYKNNLDSLYNSQISKYNS